MTTQVFLSTIPFGGFYESDAASECEREINSVIEYYMEDTGEALPDSLVERLWDSVDWGHVHNVYAGEYAESFLEWLNLDGTYESMTSPREYNFTTDRIFVELTRSDLARLWKACDRETFTKLCRSRFTSYDGFISHYSSDWTTWGRLSTWDHNQIGTLVEAVAAFESGGQFDSYAESALMENFVCNGGTHNATWENDEFAKWGNLVDYLKTRKTRPVQNMAQWRVAFAKPASTLPLFAHVATD